MDIWTPRHPHVGNNNKITLNRTNPIIPEMWDVYLELREHSVILKESYWFGTNWSSCPGVYWAALNGTQWLCGTDLRPWFLPGELDHRPLAFPGHEEEFIPLSLFLLLAKMLSCIQRLYQIYPTSFILFYFLYFFCFSPTSFKRQPTKNIVHSRPVNLLSCHLY